jgi:hypothetical protein
MGSQQNRRQQPEAEILSEKVKLKALKVVAEHMGETTAAAANLAAKNRAAIKSRAYSQAAAVAARWVLI